MPTSMGKSARISTVVLLAGAGLAGPLSAQQQNTPEMGGAMERVGTMSQLMIHLIYPTSDAVFYIDTRTPTNDAEWTALEAQTLLLAESANLLMMPDRLRDEDQWVSDAKLLWEAGRAALRAAQDRDVEALSNLNDQLYMSCLTCHEHYRPGYGTRQ